MHFTKAAEKIGISQLNLSLSIKALEEDIGTLLFDWIGKRIVLTGAGSILKKNVAMVLQNLSNALQEINDINHQKGGM